MSIPDAPPLLTSPRHRGPVGSDSIRPISRPLREVARCRLLIAHTQEIVRAGLVSILQRQPENEVVAETVDGRDAIRMAYDLHADIVVLSLSLHGMCGIEAMRQILHQGPHRRVIIIANALNELDPALVNEVLRAGARAFLLHDSAAAELGLAVRAAADGKAYLSPGIGQLVMDQVLHDRALDGGAVCLTAKQREVLQLLADGATNKQVAAALYISIKTVETHRAEIMKKLNIHTMAGLTKYAIRKGLSSLGA